jgi:hypothetical protein
MATKTHAWYFASGSNPNKLYETLSIQMVP